MQHLSENTDAQIEKLEEVCKDQEHKHKENTLEVEKQYKVKSNFNDSFFLYNVYYVYLYTRNMLIKKSSFCFISYQTAMAQFHDLDDRINSVATKVVHLGDQLENISIPRQRVKETEQVMKYFDEFHPGKELSPIFNDKNKVLFLLSLKPFTN